MELCLNKVSKHYDKKIAVNEVSINFSNGVYGLLGANGAGKTTLMRLICDIQDCTSGMITCNGQEIRKMGEDYRNLLGYLPQNFGYYPEFTANRFLMYMACLKGLPRSYAKEKSLELLDMVELLDVKNKKIRTFSGGMKRRLGIAQAMLNDPKILILDEPTAGLDPKERVRFRNLISSFARDRIVLLSTHIVSDVEFIAGTILLMKNGEIVLQGAPYEVTRQVDGSVWEFSVPTQNAESIMQNYRTANMRNEGELTVLRVIQKEKPVPEARSAKASLEDLYLNYFA